MSETAQRRIALGLAIGAVALAGVATFVVISRTSAPKPAPAAAKAELEDKTVALADVKRLGEFGSVEKAAPGVRIKSPSLAKALGLEPDDVITAISGVPITRDFEAFTEVSLATMRNAQMFYVEIARGDQQRLVRWRIDGWAPKPRDALGMLQPVTPPTLPTPPPLSSSGRIYGGLLGTMPDPDPLVATITKIDDTHYEIPRASVDKIIADPVKYGTQTRIVPAIKNGKPSGFKLYAIRPSSLIAHLGFNNGDTLESINGFALDSMQSALEAYNQLHDKDAFIIEIDRRGLPVTIHVTVTK